MRRYIYIVCDASWGPSWWSYMCMFMDMYLWVWIRMHMYECASICISSVTPCEDQAGGSWCEAECWDDFMCSARSFVGATLKHAATCCNTSSTTPHVSCYWGMWRKRVAVWCSVLQCVAVCCKVLRCVAVCCSVLQCAVVCCNILQCGVVSRVRHDLGMSMLQCFPVYRDWGMSQVCVAVCCSVLQCVAECCSVLQRVAVWDMI